VHLLLSLPVLAVILSAAKDPDAPTLPLSLEPLCQRLPPVGCSLQAQKNKFQKSGKFSSVNLLSFPATFSPQLHHDLPRKKPRSAHPNSQTPPQKRPFRFQKINQKKTPKPFCGLGAIGLQTARKPNSVLDDHSSTRRITAAL
jgi:hypothetical protein